MKTCQECTFWNTQLPYIKAQDPKNGCCTNKDVWKMIKCVDIRTDLNFGCNFSK